MKGGALGQRPGTLLLIAGVVALSIASDQYTKHVARARLPAGQARTLLGGLVVLTRAENEGAFLSLGAGWPRPVRTAVFSGISSLVVAAAGAWLLVRRPPAATALSLALVVGGGAGNLVDRLTRGGCVTDFLNVGIGRLRTGIFNLADVFLLAGALLLVVAPAVGDGRSRLSPRLR